jgi:hypothetical protein
LIFVKYDGVSAGDGEADDDERARHPLRPEVVALYRRVSGVEQARPGRLEQMIDERLDLLRSAWMSKAASSIQRE